jgi:methylated-DNA-[protein]-cysteine S-methyltransferase
VEEMMSNTFFTHCDSPVGQLLLVANDAGLKAIDFCDAPNVRPPQPGWIPDAHPLTRAMEQLRAYFAGELRMFDFPLAPEGTPFQLRVWRQLQEIPYGGTISYGQLARMIGNPNASRAVGLANGRNPIPIVIPCHRVIGSNGKLVGYGGGLPIKEKLLKLERALNGEPAQLLLQN